jgi:hypothetical protein
MLGTRRVGDANVMRYDAPSWVESRCGVLVVLRRGDVVHGATAGWCLGCVRLRQAASGLLCLCVRQAAKANRDLTSFAPSCHDVDAYFGLFARC